LSGLLEDSMMKFLLVLLLIPTSYAFAESHYSQTDYLFDGYTPPSGIPREIYFDYSKLELEILEVKRFFIPKWVDEPGDFSNLLQVKFNLTNNGLENYSVLKNMFQIDVIDPREQNRDVRRTSQNFRVDNYFPEYIDHFEIRFKHMTLPQSLYECELLNHHIRINQTQTLSICFDIRELWSNESLDLNGPKLYYLVMMDNKFSTSCPNCKYDLLNDYYKNPISELLLPPRTQIYFGIPADEVSCKEGMHLVFKKSGSPACVKPSSVEKLLERGWIEFIQKS